jgi:hypothetical protein
MVVGSGQRDPDQLGGRWCTGAWDRLPAAWSGRRSHERRVILPLAQPAGRTARSGAAPGDRATGPPGTGKTSRWASRARLSGCSSMFLSGWRRVPGRLPRFREAFAPGAELEGGGAVHRRGGGKSPGRFSRARFRLPRASLTRCQAHPGSASKMRGRSLRYQLDPGALDSVPAARPSTTVRPSDRPTRPPAGDWTPFRPPSGTTS